MSYEIPDLSPKRAVAVKFGAELRRALEKRNVGWRQLNAAMGKDMHSIVDRYKRGRILPRLGQAAELAEALAWPELVEIVREYREGVCPIDGRTFVNDGGSAKVYCGLRCQAEAARRRAVEQRMRRVEAEGTEGDPGKILALRVERELEMARANERRRVGRSGKASGGYVSRRELRVALVEFATGMKGRQQKARKFTQKQLDLHQMTVEAMCNACEPEGLCRTAECPLRPVSPLRYVPMVDVGLAERQMTRVEIWEANPKRRIEQSVRSMAMHQQPGRSEELRTRTRRWWSSLTPEERREHVAKVQASRKLAPGVRYRECGCPNRRHADDCPLRQRAALLRKQKEVV